MQLKRDTLRRVITDTSDASRDYMLAEEICQWLDLPMVQVYDRWDFFDDGGRYRSYTALNPRQRAQ